MSPSGYKITFKVSVSLGLALKKMVMAYFRTTSKCSPMASQCCSSQTCDFVPAGKKKLCVSGSDCTEKGYCDGLSATCPSPPNLPDGTPCYDNLKVRICFCVHLHPFGT